MKRPNPQTEVEEGITGALVGGAIGTIVSPGVGTAVGAVAGHLFQHYGQKASNEMDAYRAAKKALAKKKKIKEGVTIDRAMPGLEPKLSDFLKKAAKTHTGSDWVERYANDAAKELSADKNEFAKRLKAASEAHHEYEKKLGKADPDWAGWYANHMTGKLNEEKISDESRELSLYATNHAGLYRQQIEPVINNLRKHKAKGVYDHEKAMKAWGHVADSAAQLYHKEFGSKDTPWHKMFNTTHRRDAAKEIADHYDELVNESVNEGVRPGSDSVYDSHRYNVATDRMGHVTITNKSTKKSVYVQGDDAVELRRGLNRMKTNKVKPEFWDHALSDWDHVMEDTEEASVHVKKIPGDHLYQIVHITPEASRKTTIKNGEILRGIPKKIGNDFVLYGQKMKIVEDTDIITKKPTVGKRLSNLGGAAKYFRKDGRGTTEFLNKHSVERAEDAEGNGDDVFNATNIQKDTTRAADQSLGEENINERVLGADDYQWYRYRDSKPTTLTRSGLNPVTLNKGDLYGIRQAHSSRTKHRVVAASRGLSHVYTIPSSEASTYMAKGKAVRGVREETINELSRGTLASYVAGASNQIGSDSHYAGMVAGSCSNHGDLTRTHRHIYKRERGIDKALHRLAQEETNINEALSPAQKERREKIVLQMKKKAGDWRKRYGKEAKRVMYGTATKLAKEESIAATIDRTLKSLPEGTQIESPSCPACGGEGNLLGALGRRAHFRCRDCGMDFSHEEERHAKAESNLEKSLKSLKGRNLRMEAKEYDPLDDMIAHEEGELDEKRTKRLFQHLVDTGQAWTLQGHYGRTAKAMIDSGFIKPPKDRLYPGIKPVKVSDLTK